MPTHENQKEQSSKTMRHFFTNFSLFYSSCC